MSKKPLDVPKTKKEKILNSFYMDFFIFDMEIPQVIKDKFLRDSETIRYDNPIYKDTITKVFKE